ncbi:MAG: hypothetical protein NVS3B10_20340 [Polyangiales bacterium]
MPKTRKLPNRTKETDEGAGRRALPAALAKRAAALSRQKIARLVSEARKDIALLRRKRGDIAAAFYDMGEALVRLKKPDVYGAFKRPSWEAFCEAELAISESQAERLIAIVRSMTREDAIKLGTFSKASSVARLVQATPAGETVAQAIREGVVVGNKRIDVKRASVRGIAAATREVPRERGKRGRHISVADAAVAARLKSDVARLGLDARVTAKAGMAGKEARLVIEVALSEAGKLGRVLARAK